MKLRYVVSGPRSTIDPDDHNTWCIIDTTIGKPISWHTREEAASLANEKNIEDIINRYSQRFTGGISGTRRAILHKFLQWYHATPPG